MTCAGAHSRWPYTHTHTRMRMRTHTYTYIHTHTYAKRMHACTHTGATPLGPTVPSADSLLSVCPVCRPHVPGPALARSVAPGGTLPRLFAISFDISAAYDSFDSDRIIRIIRDQVLLSERYSLMKIYTLSPERSGTTQSRSLNRKRTSLATGLDRPPILADVVLGRAFSEALGSVCFRCTNAQGVRGRQARLSADAASPEQLLPVQQGIHTDISWSWVATKASLLQDLADHVKRNVIRVRLATRSMVGHTSHGPYFSDNHLRVCVCVCFSDTSIRVYTRMCACVCVCVRIRGWRAFCPSLRSHRPDSSIASTTSNSGAFPKGRPSEPWSVAHTSAMLCRRNWATCWAARTPCVLLPPPLLPTARLPSLTPACLMLQPCARALHTHTHAYKYAYIRSNCCAMWTM